jgi:hypothetical protein
VGLEVSEARTRKLHTMKPREGLDGDRLAFFHEGALLEAPFVLLEQSHGRRGVASAQCAVGLIEELGFIRTLVRRVLQRERG